MYVLLVLIINIIGKSTYIHPTIIITVAAPWQRRRSGGIIMTVPRGERGMWTEAGWVWLCKYPSHITAK